MTVYIKNTYKQMDGKIFISDPCLYCKMYLPRPKEQIYKSGLDSSGTPCI